MQASETPMPPAAAPPAPGACLITGAATRIGRSIALAMAKAGWEIALHYRHSEKQAFELEHTLNAAGHRAASFKADLSQESSVHRLFDAVIERFAGINCVINNASLFEFDSPRDAGAESLVRHYQANLIAPVLLTQRLHAHLKPRHLPGSDPLGVVIHLLDQKLANPNPDFFSYTLAKAALLEATRLCAAALAPVIRVVGIGPGISLPSADQTQEEFERAHAMTPLGASSHPQEIAEAVVWLSQARAITGTMVLVDGGQHLAASPRDVMMVVRS